jgi:hypothetical protein
VDRSQQQEEDQMKWHKGTPPTSGIYWMRAINPHTGKMASSGPARCEWDAEAGRYQCLDVPGAWSSDVSGMEWSDDQEDGGTAFAQDAPANVVAFPRIPLSPMRTVYDAAHASRLFLHAVVVTAEIDGVPDDVRAKHGELVVLILDPSKPNRYDRATSDEHGMTWPLNFGGRECKVFVPWSAINGLTAFQRTPEIDEAKHV